MDLTKIKPIKDEPFPFGPIQTEWLEALESGQWKQCQKFLREPGKPEKAYCCLGVLCELLGLSWHDGHADNNHTDAGFTYKSPDPRDGFVSATFNGYLPTSFGPTVGLRDAYGGLKKSVETGSPEKPSVWSLADMNDELNLTFEE